MTHRDNIFLSDRLMMSAEMVSPGFSVADVGCDHAHTSIWLVKERNIPFAIAMDVRKGPLEHAKANISLYGLEKRISVRLSDGLEALEKGETDSVIMAGMGGTLTVIILKNGIEKAAAAKELILQPQSDIGMVRTFLRINGFVITEERMCREDGKFYNSLRAVPITDCKGSALTGMPKPEAKKEQAARAASDGMTGQGMINESDGMTEVYDEFGEYLLKNRHPLLYEYLRVQYGKTLRISERIASEGSGNSAERKMFFKNRRGLIEKALRFYEG